MTDLDNAMLLINSIDSSASLRFSRFTRRWYVESKIEVSDGVILSGITEHRSTPADAVHAFLNVLQEVPLDKVLVTKAMTERRHWRWNGAAFAEEPVKWLSERARSRA